MVVAVSDYSKGLAQLAFCNNDGVAVSGILRELGYDMSDNFLLGNVEGSTMRDKILKFFYDTTIKSDDVILFYFSGHGCIDQETVYLASSNIDPKVPVLEGFSFDDLTKAVNSCVSTRIIIILDCCYSGSAKINAKSADQQATQSSKIMNEGGKLLQHGEGKCLLAASMSYQEAFADSSKSDKSIFTHYLVQGLKGDIDALDTKGNVTPDSLGTFVYDNVTAIFPNQKPVRKIEAAGKIVLASFPDKLPKTNILIKPKIDPKKTYAEAKELQLKGKYSEAISKYNDVVTVDSKNLKAWYNKGKAHEQMVNYTAAIASYTKAIDIDSKDDVLWNSKGVALAKINNWEEALACFEEAHVLNPNEPDYVENKGIAFTGLDKMKDAKKCKKQAKEMKKSKIE